MAEVQYSIADIRQFAFSGSQRPDDVIRATAEAVLREIAASATLDEMLTDRRSTLERQSLARLRHRLESHGLGIEVANLQWLDVHPPKEIVPAYRQVADALEDREVMINAAEAYATRSLVGTIGQDVVDRLQSTSKRKLDEESRRGSYNWELNDNLWRELIRLNDAGTLTVSGSVASILNEGHMSSERFVESAKGKSEQIERLLVEYRLNPSLTNRQLYWSMITETLSKRSLTIIDPRAAARRHIWLDDQPAQPKLLPND
jgi:regulator of protease activity HflC (stomatin/prohibitin superfamily)